MAKEEFIADRPWKRRPRVLDAFPGLPYSMVQEHSPKLSFYHYEFANMDLDVTSKIAALKVSSSVVSIETHSGKEMLFYGSGTIVDCHQVDDSYHGIILSSATLIRRARGVDGIADNIKVSVHLSGGRSYEGTILSYDLHYNILLLEIISDVKLSVATLKLLDDSLSGSSIGQRLPQSEAFQVFAGSTLVALGRYFALSYYLMGAPGLYSIEPYEFDCKELLRLNCKISQCGIGGPIINNNGEVIGMSFYATTFTPFLPSNVALKWLESYKESRLHWPYFGMKLANLHSADVGFLERLHQHFPNISSGVIVQEVDKGSPIDLAGLHVDDIIVNCSGSTVQSILQFFEVSCEKAGESLELAVIRPNESLSMNISVASEISPHKTNRWPLPKVTSRIKRREGFTYKVIPAKPRVRLPVPQPQSRASLGSTTARRLSLPWGLRRHGTTSMR